MNIKKSIFGMVTLSLFLMSCGNSSDQKNNQQTETVAQEEPQHGEKSVAIELNNGEKWTVNAEMTPYILDGAKLLSQYDGNDYTALAKQLKQKNTSLIKSCTMDGKSHDELHKWLHPHLELVDALSAAPSKEDADKTIMQLVDSYKIYNQHFQ